MSKEIEYKYSAAPEVMAAVAEKFTGWETIAMATSYFDTPEGFLSQRKWMLRLRRENDKTVCCLKVPLEKNICGEWETESDSLEAGIPVLCKLGAPKELADLTNLSQFCGAEFTRRAARIFLEGAEAELALDQGFLTGGGKRQPLGEIEVEHKAGDPALTLAFARQLAAEFSLAEEPRSKIARARKLAEGDKNG